VDSKDFDWVEFHFTDSLQNINHITRWPIVVFLVTAFLCLFFSSLFHLFYSYARTHQTYNWFLRLDYSGISLLISGSTFPPLYYGFYCQLEVGIFYMALIGLACFCVFIMSLKDFFHKIEFLTKKSLTYGCLGVFAGVPIFHLYINEAYLNNFGDLYSSNPAVPYFLLMGVAYLGGLSLYARRCPERYHPGKFDICGASHQIWHFSIIVGIIMTYIGAILCHSQRI